MSSRVSYTEPVDDPVLKEFSEGVRSRGLEKEIKVIYLFGSRARGDERPDSDYDLFLVVTDDFVLPDKSRIYDVVMDVFLKTGRFVSLKIRREKEFQRLRELETPFIRNLLKEGIEVG